MKKRIYIIDTADNVGVALDQLKENEKVKVSAKKEITIKDDISYGHKVAIKKIHSGDKIIKYGEVIGKATKEIDAGSLVHTNNIESLRGRGDLGK